MHRRCPAARHQHKVTGNIARRGHLSVVNLANRHRTDTQMPCCAGDGCAGHNTNSGRRRLITHGAAIGARIDDRRHFDTRRMKLQRGLIGIIRGGKEHSFCARLHAIAVEERARRAGLHNAGAVIVGKHQWPLDRAGGQNHLFGPHLPHALARGLAIHLRQMVGEALDKADKILLVIAEGRGARQRADALMHRHHHQHIQRPLMRLAPVNRLTMRGEQRAAKFTLLVADDDIGTRLCRRQRSGQARRASAHHQHITMGIALGIMVRVRLFGCNTQTRRMADHRLIELVPQRLWPHEGFIIKPRRKHRRQQIIHLAHIQRQRRPAVLAGGHKPVIKLNLTGAKVGRCAPPAPIHADQRVGLVRTH